MAIIKLKYLIFLLLAVLGTNLAAINTAAVYPFTNDTEQKSLDFLSGAIVNTVNTEISKVRNIRLLEREKVEILQKEIDLQKLIRPELQKIQPITSMTAPDYIITGNYKGNSNFLTINIKVIETHTFTVITNRVVQGSLDNLFPLLEYCIREITSLLVSTEFSFLTIRSHLVSADIFVDNLFIGKSPLLQYKTTPGLKKIKLYAPGYLSYEQEVDLKKDQTKEINANLIAEIKQDVFYITLTPTYWQFLNTEITNSELIFGFGVYTGIPFGNFFAEIGIFGSANIQSNYDYDIPYNKSKKIYQDVNFFNFSGSVKYALFTTTYFVQYFGLEFGGGTLDFNEIPGDSSGEAKTTSILRSKNSVILFGQPKVGFIFLPSSRIHFQLELGYFTYLSRVGFDKLTQKNLLGESVWAKHDFLMHGFSFQLGFTLGF